MGEYLPGKMQDRVRELREANGYNNHSKLAEAIGVDRSTISRIENGEIKKISSETLIKMSKLFNVPTDYILGLSDTPENTGYDIRELGLSVEAAKMLYLKKVDPRVINYLLQNDKFAAATRSMALYFTNSIARMIITQNHLLNNSFGIVDELINTGKIPNDRQMKDLKRNLKAAKLPLDTYEIERIDRQLMAAVREIKKKTMTEVADRLENENILDFEVMAKVKEEILASPSMNDLTDEEKLAMIKNTIMDGILVYADLDEKKIALIDPLVEQIALLLIEIWKEF